MTEKYSAYIASQVSDAASASQETTKRAITVVTTAGGLVTLLSALVGFATINRKDAFFPASARGVLGWALVFFVAAAVVALVTQLPLLIAVPEVESLEKLVTESWGDTEKDAGQQVAAAQVDQLKTDLRMNTIRSWLLIGAITAEVVAVALTGVTAGRIVHSIPKGPPAAATGTSPSP